MGRNDARQVYDIPTLNQVYPFMMRRRCDSLVYQTVVVDVTDIVTYIKRKRAQTGQNYRIFDILATAILRTIATRPQLNRFVANRRYWQRNDLSFNFIVKEDFSDEAPEHSKPLEIKPDMTLEEISGIIEENIEEGKKPQVEGPTDRVVEFFFRFPKWFIGSVVNVAGLLDKFGHAPKALRDIDGLHTSIFISNLGSIGLEGSSPHHHLYEWGTTSLFMTIGMMNHKRLPDGTLRQLLEVGFTIDERITDGWYFAQSLRIFKHFVANPEELEQRPELPPPLKTKKQVKADRKQARKNAKLAVKEQLTTEKEKQGIV
jgi:hypothetical protein